MKPRSASFLSVILVLFLCLTGTSTALAASKVALLFGNSNYADAPLKNPANDASDLASVLDELGFVVIHEDNASKKEMVSAMRRFYQNLEPDGVALFFYAGHGVQWRGQNYLIPVNADIENAADLSFEAMDAQRVLGYMEEAGTKLNIVILDACRNNPYRGWSRGAERGLARMDSIRGSIIAYSTQPGNVAEDGNKRNSPYTEALLHHIKQPGLSVQEMFHSVGMEVFKHTNERQQPWYASSPTQEFCFAGCEPEDYVPGPDKESDKKVVSLLRACNTHLKANRLTSGRGGHALECYEKVLQLDPSNLAALQGITQITEKYKSWAEGAMQRRDHRALRKHTEKLKLINPENPALARFEDALTREDIDHQVTTDDRYRLFIASGTVKQNHPFAGGASCCNCRTRHYGLLPPDFPSVQVKGVTFFLSASREDSYYTRIRNGPSRLRLRLGERVAESTSQQLPELLDKPVRHSWRLDFRFDPPVQASPGIEWELLDGDNNKYSAVLLHASDKENEQDKVSALPGKYQTSECQYSRTDNAWYSVRFDFSAH